MNPSRRQHPKKSAPSISTRHWLLLLCLIAICGVLLFLLLADKGSGSQNATTDLAQEPSLPTPAASPQAAIKASPKEPPLQAPSPVFDLASWQKSFGRRWDLKDWKKDNPSTYASWFGKGDDAVAEKWFVNLGPLGLSTRMHDRSWQGFPGFGSRFPRALCDGDSLIYNCYQVEAVKASSPASGMLQKGDLILGFDGQFLECAHDTYVGEDYPTRDVRGLDIHAGLLLDAAEGRGSTTAMILRLPPHPSPALLDACKGCRSFSTLKMTAGRDLPLPPGTDQLMLGKGKAEDYLLVSPTGATHQLGGFVGKTRIAGGACEVPPGEWSLKCSGSKPVSEVQVSIRPALPAVLKPYYREVTIPLPCIGSFGQPADLHGAKMKNMAQVMAARLAVQQSPDGCWQASSYAGNVFPTSIAGLALLSAGDPLYDAQIRKAAYFCAYGTPAPGWSYAQGCRLLFLAEYYLRSRDPGILLGLKTVAAETRRYVLADFTSGHGLGGVGYGGSGYIGGGGMIALGFAAASLTPALDAADKSLLDAMLMRIQELAPAGKVPYGRGGSNESTEDDGHAASCATGPYFLASLIRGGSANFVKAARHRYSQGHYGDVDAGHASMTLHFTMGMLAVAACGEDCYRRAVSTKAWYLTLMRDADGSANSNNYRIEFHGGDGVLGSPYWRTAGMILCLNALKHNLAITGMPEARRQSPQDGPQLFHQDAALRRVLLGNWDLVEVTLGSAAGPAFRQARKDLAAISPERDFSRKFHAFISTGSGHAALAEILRQPQVSQEVAQGQLAELMLGLAIEADCLPDVEPDEEEEGAGGKQVAAADSKAQAKARKKQHKELKKQLEAGAVVDLEYVLHLGIGGFRSISSRFAEASPLPLEDFKAGIRCGGACPIKESLIWQPRYQPASRKEDGGYGEFSRSFPMRSDGIPVFEIDISYRALGLPISYRAKLTGPSPIARGHNPALVRVPVKAQVLEDYAGQYTLLLRLANGNLLPCENHAKVQPPDFLPAGNSVTAWISPETLWGHDLRQVAMGSFASPRELPCQTSGGACVLGDHKLESSVKVGPGESTVELVLGQPGETGLVWVAWKDKDVKRAFQVELKLADGTWQRSACSERPGLISLPHHKCTAMRLVFAPGKALDLAECRLYSPPRIEVQRRLQP